MKRRSRQDFDQTHASALRIVSLRCLAAIQSREGLCSARIDLVSAYLQGDLKDGDIIYMHQPPGHQVNGDDGRPRVCLILKPVYGMCQGGRRLQRKLFPWMLRWEDGAFTQLDADACVFVAREGNDLLIVAIYVDDACCLHRHDGEDSLYARFYRDFHAA